jgi:hypothetical protein
MKHTLKYTRKTETAWCSCGRWRIKNLRIPWVSKPSEELVTQTEKLLAVFEKHVQESK